MGGTLARWGPRLRIAAGDGSHDAPRLLWPHLPARPFGHGLYRVERLTGRWGVTARSDGKTVWAELRVPRPPRIPSTEPTGLIS
ncbi:ATP-binding protein [Streptacidiphilus anmyonensis]|uniref:ATP-binding protein n=1 Tax=Streptacidiphilus anmyonensis TaxID=405782 RepID=UPI000694B9FF|nr:ATP-binding protein [Streptacidiphilus anmyonensis]